MHKLIAAPILLISLACCTNASAENSKPLVDGMNQFAFATHQKLYQPNQNAVYSPYSLSFLLELLVNGSAGETRVQLMQSLHLDEHTNLTALNTDLDQMNNALTLSPECADKPNCKIRNEDFIISNALWADEGFSYNQSYLDNMKRMQSVNFYRVNFQKSSDKAKDQINAWVDKSTQGYIQNLLTDPLSPNTKLILTNAIYFKGLWALPFDIKQTNKQSFTSDTGTQSITEMMHQTSHFNYAETDNLQMLLLNYNKSNLAMAIILPKSKHSLNEIIQTLTNDQFTTLINNAKTRQPEVITTLPRFKIDSRFADDLKQALVKIGLQDAFNPVKANFANMVASKSPNDALFISQVIQKAVIDVDEKGTVAAAATAITMMTRAMAPTEQPKPVVFTANHPFLFIIYDMKTSLILFIGEVNKV